MLNFCCPVCKEELKLDGRTYRCINNHCFDCAKQGYVNLLQSNKSKSKRHGDDKLMIEARTEFLNTDSYKPLQAAVRPYVRTFAKIYSAKCLCT